MITNISIHIDAQRGVTGFIKVHARGNGSRHNVAFDITGEGSYHQWGAPVDVMRRTGRIIERIEQALRETELGTLCS